MEIFTLFSCHSCIWPQGPEATVLERAGPELGGQGRLLGTRIEEPFAEAIVQEKTGRKRLE